MADKKRKTFVVVEHFTASHVFEVEASSGAEARAKAFDPGWAEDPEVYLIEDAPYPTGRIEVMLRETFDRRRNKR